MEAHKVAVDPGVRAARASIQAMDAETLAEQIRIVQIPAPANDEGERAAYVSRRFVECGLEAVCTDEVGNVIGWLPGDRPGPPVVISAHLDTVFGPDVPLAPRQDGSRVIAPGITDNARGVAALITLSRAVVRHPLPFSSPVAMIATVGEEGAGDLRGVRHVFRPDGPFAAVAAFVALDGSGLRRIVHRGVGSRRLRVTLRGPGGHSWSDWGAANPAHALGTAIAALADLPLSESPVATLTVARMGGGTSINAIPDRAWLEVDLRSESASELDRIDAESRARIDHATAAENERRRAGTTALTTTIEVIGNRPAGETPANHALVAAAQRATRSVGARPELVASSTDANIPMSLGIPAVTLGAGGRSGGVHTPAEWYDNKGGALGIERALLLLAEVAGIREGRG